MEQSKQFPASHETHPAPPPTASNKRPSNEPSEAVKQFGTRMVQGLNNFKAPLPSANERPILRRSAAVEHYITRMVAGMNNFKAEK
ncbi:MAG: hypothetical protein WCA21_02965 [Terracidiphilus sp.]